MSFEELGLTDAVLRGLKEKGYENPTDIQAQAIPKILEGKDIVGSSQTGTGKTAAFLLPIFQRLEKHGRMRVLILEPTRELAHQVMENCHELGKHTDFRYCLVHGGVGYGKQNDEIKAGVDIIIATPGRLLDLMSKGTISLRDIDFLVLDEVDRMLDMGFLPDVRKIILKCPEDRNTLFFSATMPAAIESLAKWCLQDPHKIDIGQRRTPAETINHAFFPVSIEQRKDLLKALLEQTDFKSVMIFTRTKMEANDLTAELKRSDRDYRVTVMHSDIKQSDRTKALAGFRSGDFDIIIATDIAARGLDISGVTHVINYRVPENAEDYVHRIGRTGRAQQEGDAFTILSADEIEFADSIERFIGKRIQRRKLPEFDYIYTTLLDVNAPSADKLKSMLGRARRPSGPRRRRR